MDKTNNKNLILKIFSIVFWLIVSMSLYYKYDLYYSEYSALMFMVSYVFISSIFCFFTYYIYNETEKYKIETFKICFICSLICILCELAIKNDYLPYYISGTFADGVSDGSIITISVLYLLLWTKINWIIKQFGNDNIIGKIKKIIRERQNKSNELGYFIDHFEKKSLKKKNVFLKIMNVLNENSIVVLLLILVLGVIIFDVIPNKDYNWYKYLIDEIYAIIGVWIAYIIISIMQLILASIIRIFSKKYEKFIYILTGALVTVVVCAVILPSFSFGSYVENIVSIMEENKRKADERDFFSKDQLGVTRNYLNKFDIAEDITKADVGYVVKFGKDFLRDDIRDVEDSYYYVLEKEDNVLTLISLYCIDIVEEEELLKHGNEGCYNYLDGQYYQNAFTDVEKNMMVDIVSSDNKKHKVFVPNTKDVFLLAKYDNNLHHGYMSEKILNRVINTKSNKVTNNSTKYLIEPHILKPHTIRLKETYYDDKYGDSVYGSAGRIVDYDDTKEIKLQYGQKVFLRPKIKVDISKQ